MSSTPVSVFTQFVAVSGFGGGFGNAVVGLTRENWPANAGGYPMLASQQIGDELCPAVNEATYPWLWISGAPGGTISPYLPQVDEGSSPAIYQQLVAGIGVPAIYGLTASGAIALAAEYQTTGWQAGQMLPLNPNLTSCTTFLVSGGTTVVVVGLTSGGVPVLASMYESGQWSAGSGDLPLNPSASPYDFIAGASGYDGSWYVFGLDAAGTPYIATAWNGAWTAGDANNGTGPNSLAVPSGVAFSSLYPVANNSTLTLYGIATDGTPWIVSSQDIATGTWSAGSSMANQTVGYTYQALAPIVNFNGQVVLFGLTTAGGIQLFGSIEFLGNKEPGLLVYFEDGAPVVFEQLVVIPDGGTLGQISVLGLSQAGQICEVGVYFTSTAVIWMGQGLLPGLFAQNYFSARAFAAQLATNPGTATAFAAAVLTDLQDSWPEMPLTATTLATQIDPLSGIALPCSPPDVLNALVLAAQNNLALWAGVYGNVTAGDDYPSGANVPAFFISPAGSVYCNGFDLSALYFTFAGNVLSWSTPTQQDITNGAPAVAGSVTFSYVLPSATSSAGYFGPSFTGTINGTLGSPPSQVVAPAPSQVPALQSFSVNPSSVALGAYTTATVTLDGPAPYPGVWITILSSSPSLVCPTSTLIPAWKSTGEFYVGPFNSPVPVPGGQTMTLTVVLGTTSLTATVIGGDASTPTTADFTATFASESVTGGQPSSFTIALNAGVSDANGATFVVVSTNPAVASLANGTNVVEIAAGSSSVTVPIDTSIVGAETAVDFYVVMTSPDNVQITPFPSLSVVPLTNADVQVSFIQVWPYAGLAGGVGIPMVFLVALDNPASADVTVDIWVQAGYLDGLPASATVPAGAGQVTPVATPIKAGTPFLGANNPGASGYGFQSSVGIGVAPVVDNLYCTGFLSASPIATGTVTASFPSTASGSSVTLTSSDPSITVVSPAAQTVPAAPYSWQGAQVTWDVTAAQPSLANGQIMAALTVSGGASVYLPVPVFATLPSSSESVLPIASGVASYALGGLLALAALLPAIEQSPTSAVVQTDLNVAVTQFAFAAAYLASLTSQTSAPALNTLIQTQPSLL